METNYIKTEISTLQYPVGKYIEGNKILIKQMAKAFALLEEFKGKKLNLICRGSSGAIVATVFSLVLENDIIITHIKKAGEDSHHDSCHLEPNRKNIIVDDMVASGATLNAIYNKLSTENPQGFSIDCICITGYAKKLEFESKVFMSSWGLY
jgi:adenine/guanine phosphoribosyltransferase-like PRPP-binding protein